MFPRFFIFNSLQREQVSINLKQNENIKINRYASCFCNSEHEFSNVQCPKL